MTLSVKVGGAWKAVNNIWVRKGGVWKGVSKLSVRTGGAWNLAHDDSSSVPPDVAGGLNAHLNKSSVTGSIPGIGVVTTDNVQAIVDEGLAPYTYAWTKVSGATFNIGSPDNATTNFNININTVDTTLTAIYKCTITDSIGRTKELNVNVSASTGHNLMSAKISPRTANAAIISVGYDENGYATDVGLRFDAVVTGGSGSYTYEWSVVGLTYWFQIDSYHHASWVRCHQSVGITPQAQLKLVVKDSSGQSSSDIITIEQI